MTAQAAAFSRCEFGIVGRTRGEGRAGSAVAAASYNLCARLTDEGGTRYDFSRKRGERVGGCVLLPPGAPPELSDPGALWRAAEAAERRSDAQLARQVLLSIPRELPPEHRLAWVTAIAQPWVADGAAVQIDLHAPQAADGQEQPHAHLLVSLRRVTDEGFARTKAREWNQAFREDGGRAERRRIEQRANAWLEARSLPVRLDLRSLADRGDPRPPEPSAPRADWQRWLREGADPKAAPIRVAAALAHRGRRTALAAAEAEVAAAATEAADLRRQLAAVPAPVATPAASVATARRRAAHAVTQQPQEATMARRPQRTSDRRPSSPPRQPQAAQAEPWMRYAGGLDALPARHRASAERSYAAWAARRPGLADRHDLAAYVSYVQGRHADRPEAPEQPQPEAAPGIGPAVQATGEDRRHAHLAALLADRYPAPSGDLAAYVSRYQADPASRMATLYLREGGRILDRGDRLELKGELTPEAAQALAAAAAAHGWSPARVTGPPAFRSAVAEAAALRTPPLLTDCPLPPAARERVAQALRERAAAAVPALDPAAVAALAAADPRSAALATLAHAEACARAALSGRPTGSTDPEALAAPRLAELAERRATAREDAEEAAQAAAQHRGEHGLLDRLRDPAARRRQAALDAEAGRLGREADQLDRGHGKAVRDVEKGARREALATVAALEDWRYSPAVRAAQRQLAAVQQVRAAVERGDQAVTQAAARGDLRTAAQSAQQTRQAEAPADPRTAAVLALAAAEQHAQDPAALARARATTAAAVAGDPATVAAAASGDLAAAQRAAQEWQERQRQEDEQRRRERAAVLARAPQQPQAAGPGL